MTPAETATILRQFNDRRRGCDVPNPKPSQIGRALDAAVEMIERLEAAEKAWKISDQTVYDLTEKVIPNIQEKLEAAEKELVEIRHGAAVANDTIKALRAKIEAMERQEPVAWTTRRALESVGRGTLGFHACGGNLWGEKGVPLYALPGAQPAPSVPEGWQLVPTAESRHPGIYRMLNALHAADNTPGMSEWESYRAMLNAAPEVKPDAP